MDDDGGPTLDINYTCLYGEYKDNQKILDLMTRVKQNEQFTRDHGVDDDVCSTLFKRVDRKKRYVDSFNPTIIIRSGPVVVGFVDVDTNNKYTILEHVCTTKGYGSISLAITENVIWNPCKELKSYSEFPKESLKESTIRLDNVITGTFYERCGYKVIKVVKDKNLVIKEMEKTFDAKYVKKLRVFLENENILYEDIDTFYKMIDIKTYIPTMFGEWKSK